MKRLIVELADRFAGFTPGEVLSSLEETQYWSAERLQELQLAAMRRLLVHASLHVPHYRELFRRLGFDAGAFASMEDLRALPVLDRQEVLAAPERFISETAQRPLVWLRTSGSTGIPFRFVRTRIAQSYKIASRLRFRGWYGVSRTSPQLLVSGIVPRPHERVGAAMHKLHMWATGRREVFAPELHGAGLDFPARLLERGAVTSIMGYPSAIAAIADYMAQTRRQPKNLAAVFVNSETPLPWMRDAIKRGLGVEARSDYVATEGSIAHECPEGGLHVDVEEAFVETGPQSGNCGVEELLMTFLHTFDFPLIRYRIGDVGKLSSFGCCSCGRAAPLLTGSVGRHSDAVRLPSGARVTAASINLRIAHLPFIDQIAQYQIAQLSADEVELRLVRRPGMSPDTPKAFAQAVGKVLEPLCVTVREVATIDREPNGKFRAVVALPECAAEVVQPV